MRTTITISNKIMDALKETAIARNMTYKATLEFALEEGLKMLNQKKKSKKIEWKTFPMKIRRGLDLDKTSTLLEFAEGENFR
jgi:hypothetical protein